jgi:site-specific DNA-methyltransferase (adenine-specific)
MTNISLINGDSLAELKAMEDNSIDLILTDPPYGINIAKKGSLSIKGSSTKSNTFKPSEWDSCIPHAEYFKEMQRVAKNLIVWGGNYFTEFLPPKSCWLVWYKKDGLPAKTFADCEMAWTSFNKPSRVFNSRWHGFIRDSKEERYAHPTQKPLDLMKWCLENYTKEGDLVMDCFMGTGTTGVACVELKRKFIGIEIDCDYFKIAQDRINITIENKERELF